MANRTTSEIPIIDIFAGPGGLGEGFSAFTDARGNRPFKIAISVEKETNAHKTLLVRSFYRQFPPGEAPPIFYKHLRGEIGYESFIAEIQATPQGIAALDEARRHELGADVGKDAELSKLISKKIAGRECILIGGPPCQAYSLVGRSRNMGKENYRLETDPKAKLYLEYLQLIADVAPAVFVMENVKGLLSSKMDGVRVFDKIRDDLCNPAEALRREGRRRNGSKATYRLHALSHEGLFSDLAPRDFVVRCEEHGIPQARHRVILVGVRDDLGSGHPGALRCEPGPPVQTMLRDLPRLRSALSKEPDTAELWADAVLELCTPRLQKQIRDCSGDLVAERIMKLQSRRRRMLKLGRGGEFIHRESNCSYEPGWFSDPRLGGVCNHATRSHIRSDLLRYAFAASYADVNAQHLSPSLADFPSDFLPKHANVDEAIAGMMFGDRFRVQVRSRPSTTVTSHISKDGHYYIHYDPSQCRSLTVREAARLQTFPDNYFFEGPRTSQYTQVGNAVPPLLAVQIAEIVAKLLS